MLINYLICYEDEPLKDEPPKDDPPKDQETFTQDDLNRIIAKETDKYKKNQRKLMDELNALKTKTNLTEEERKEFEQRVEELNNQLLTKEELTKKEREKEQKKFNQQIEELTSQSEHWKTKYTESTIQRTLMDAAVSNNAFRAEQIIALLRPNTRLTEVLEDGKPTGDYEVRVKIKSTDDKGKPVTLDLSAADAVKHLKEDEAHTNLFKGSGSGGFGGTTSTRSKPEDILKTLKDPAAYRKLRKSKDISDITKGN